MSVWLHVDSSLNDSVWRVQTSSNHLELVHSDVNVFKFPRDAQAWMKHIALHVASTDLGENMCLCIKERARFCKWRSFSYRKLNLVQPIMLKHC